MYSKTQEECHKSRRSEEVLSYLPAANSQQEAKNIGLLLLLKFFDVFEGTHLQKLRQLMSSMGERGMSESMEHDGHTMDDGSIEVKMGLCVCQQAQAVSIQHQSAAVCLT